MTQDEIIRMAREAGLLAKDEAWVSPHQEAMERFAALVAAHEREACAKVCDKISWLHEEDQVSGLEGCTRVDAADDCAAAIRARGE